MNSTPISVIRRRQAASIWAIASADRISYRGMTLRNTATPVLDGTGEPVVLGGTGTTWSVAR